MTAENNSFYAWPLSMARLFNSSLMPLLAQGSQISLERLQVVSMSIALKNVCSSTKTSLKHVDEDFLTLEHCVEYEPGNFATVSIRYFVRGRRQYFRNNPPAHAFTHDVMLPPICEHDIRDFLRAIEQPNSALHEKDQAQLVGRRDVMVPSQMVMALCLNEALKISRGRDFLCKRVEADFLRTVWVKEELRLSYSDCGERIELGLFAGEQCVAGISLSCARRE